MEYKKSQSLSEQVADEILDMIVVKKQFKIGDKLPNETELSALLNVSRTTLREAIKMLVLQDIVEIKRGKGTFVKSDEVDNFTLGNLKSNTSKFSLILFSWTDFGIAIMPRSIKYLIHIWAGLLEYFLANSLI